MKVIYGGLELKLVRVLLFDRQPVLDDTGTDYLFTKFTLHAVAVLNSQTTAYRPFPVTEGMSYARDYSKPHNLPPYTQETPFFTNPTLTDATVRHWLTVPRRQLKIVAGDGETVLLNSPRPNRFCDSHNGPVCEVFSIQHSLGDARTFIVNFQVTTYVNECEEAELRFGAMLSNRFEQWHELDEDYGLTVVTRGVAHFRTDLIFDPFFGFPLANPDNLRPFLMLPIPPGFKRLVRSVHGLADVSGIEYEFADVQQPYQFVTGDEVGATRVDAVYREALISGQDPLGKALDAIERNTSYRWSRRAANEPEAGNPKGPPPHVPPAPPP